MSSTTNRLIIIRYRVLFVCLGRLVVLYIVGLVRYFHRVGGGFSGAMDSCAAATFTRWSTHGPTVMLEMEIGRTGSLKSKIPRGPNSI